MNVIVEGTINTREQLNEVFSKVLASTDLTSIATLKEHTDKDEAGNVIGVKGMYLTTQMRLPGTHATTFGGEKYYTKHCAVKLDLFNISESEFAVTPTKATAAAATLDAESIKAKLAASREYAAAKAKTPKPGDVVAKNV